MTAFRAIRQDIVEERTWRQGVEIVSHVNYSLLAQLRSFRGLMPDELPGVRAWYALRPRPVGRTEPARSRIALVR
jgi:hypothetical protein